LPVISHSWDSVKGNTPNTGQIALLFDDTVVTGTSVSKVARILRREGIKIYHVYTFLDKQYGGSQVLAKEGMRTFHF